MIQALRCKPRRTHRKSAHLHSSCCKGPGPPQCTSFEKLNQVLLEQKKTSNDSLHIIRARNWHVTSSQSKAYVKAGWTNNQLFRSKIHVTPCHCTWRQRRTGWTGWTNPEIDAGHVHLPAKPAMQYAARVVCPGLKAMQCTATDYQESKSGESCATQTKHLWKS